MKKIRPKISVAIGHYNYSRFMRDVLGPLLKDERIGEIIIQDDCSDDYEAMCDIVKSMDFEGKVKIFRNPKNFGVLRNKIEPVMNCTNDWVLILDADNTCEKDYFDKLYRISKWKEDIIYCPDFAKPLFDYRQWSDRLFDRKKIMQEADRLGKLFFGTFLNTMNYFVNRQFFLYITEPYKNDGYNGIDSLYINTLWLEAGNRLKVVKGLEYLHRTHEEDGGGTYNKANQKQVEVYRRALTKRLTGQPIVFYEDSQFESQEPSVSGGKTL